MFGRPIVRIIYNAARRIRFYLVTVDYPLQRAAPIDYVLKTARRNVFYRNEVIVIKRRLVLRQAQFFYPKNRRRQ